MLPLVPGPCEYPKARSGRPEAAGEWRLEDGESRLAELIAGAHARERHAGTVTRGSVGICREPLEQLKRSLGSYGAAGQLQQRPSPAEGGILRRLWWRYYDPDADLPHFDEVLQSWDVAFSDSDGSDYVVGQVWGSFRADRYLLHQVRARLEFTERVHAVRELTDWVTERFPRHGNHRKLVEKKANGPAVMSALRSEVPGIIGVDPKGDKVARARAAAPLLEGGNLYLPGAPSPDGQGYDRPRTRRWVQNFVEECAAFPNAAHDDQVDAFSQAMTRLGTAPANFVPQAEKPKGFMHGVIDKQF